MPRVTPILTTFSSGELSPFLDGRTDIQAYYNGAKKVENFFLLPYGGLMRRPGTFFVAEVKDSDDVTRVIPFQFSTTQSYIIEIGDFYMRFYKDRGQIQSGGSAYEIVSPYAKADIFDLHFAQDADIMYIVHNDYKPQKLSRTAHDAWTITDYTPTDDPFVHNAWEASKAYSLNDYVVPIVADGFYYRCIVAGDSGASEPTFPAVLLQTVVDGGVTWRAESTSPVNYPASVTIYEQRLAFANTFAEPQAVWLTVGGNHEIMTQGPNDGDAIKYVLGSLKVNAIRWLSPGKVLLIGTLGAIFSMSSGAIQTPLTPTNVNVKRESAFGSINIIPHKIGNLVTYVQSNAKILREIGYSFDIDEYKSDEVTILSEHITGPEGIVDMDYQQSPYNMLWCIRTDGQAATMTRQIEQQLRGWSRQRTGYLNGLDKGQFESVAVIPGDDDEDEVWFVVRRYIDGGWIRYLEYLKPTIFTDQEDAYFVDCGLSINSPISIQNIQWSDDIVDEGNVIQFTYEMPTPTIAVETGLA